MAASISGTSGHEVLYPGIISFFLFLAGMGLNDIVDRKKDQKLRPERPIPNGSISVFSAKIAVSICFGISIGFALFLGKNHLYFTLLLIFFILSYNLKCKHFFLPAFFCMGACRSSNYLIGLSQLHLLSSASIYIPCLAIFVHTLSIMAMANREDRLTASIFPYYISSFLSSTCLFFFQPILATLWFLYTTWHGIQSHLADRKVVIRKVGLLVLSFSLLDACFAFSFNEPFLSIFFIFVFLLGYLINRFCPTG